MSTMDREEIVKICNLARTNSVSIDTAIKVISEYCKEHNKKQEDIDKLILALTNMTMLIPFYFNTSLEYFEKKFTVYKLYKQNFNNIDNKELILIY